MKTLTTAHPQSAPLTGQNYNAQCAHRLDPSPKSYTMPVKKLTSSISRTVWAAHVMSALLLAQLPVRAENAPAATPAQAPVDNSGWRDPHLAATNDAASSHPGVDAQGNPSVASAAAEAARAIIRRIVPQQSAMFTCEVIPQENGMDTCEIESRGGTIVLRGNSGVSIASAFSHYLREYCHAQVTWNGDQLNLPNPLPAVPRKMHTVAPVKDKFAYNYCTHGYTMAFWAWEQWERELDVIAMHGINMALIIEGQEAVWQNTFVQFGYSKEEIRQWLCAPIYQPWQFMQNMEGVLPPPQSLIDKRTALGQRIVQRCRELGIRPILQGFYGMVPFKFREKFPDAQIVEQGAWAGNLRRPDMLNIRDPRFLQIATTFLEEQRKIFGDCHYFAADPFHEGGKPGDMKRGEVYKVIQEAIRKFDPTAITVKQCWITANDDMFEAGDKSSSLALDLFCDQRPFWKKCNGYNNTPWLWCLLHNFGGNTGMEGNLPRLAADFGEVLGNPNRGTLRGFALVPEGSHQNPVIYELMTEMGWLGAPADIHAWVENYIHARYGKANPAASSAWSLLLQCNYAFSSGYSPINSIVVASPKIDAKIRGRSCAPTSASPPYDNRKLLSAWAKFLEAAPELGNADTFQYDLADVARQTLCNLARPIYDAMVAAYRTKNRDAFKHHSERLLEIIRDLDTLTGVRADWLMGAWVNEARAWGDTPEEKAYLDRCARLLLTTWVPNPGTGLNDYANREWNGLIKEYYLKRWELFANALSDDLDGKAKFLQSEVNKKLCAFEISWINGQSPLPSQPQGDPIAIAKQLHAKYAPLVEEYAAPSSPGKLP